MIVCQSITVEYALPGDDEVRGFFSVVAVFDGYVVEPGCSLWARLLNLIKTLTFWAKFTKIYRNLL